MKATTGPLYDRIINLRRKYHSENRIANGLIDSAPFLDIALLLFLFFIVARIVVLQPGIVVDLPEAAFTTGADYESLVVYVSQEGHFYFGDERITLEGLESAFAQAVHEDPEARLLVEADRRVPYDTLVRIYNRAMSTGIRKVVLGTQLKQRPEVSP
jgi:biopolymer transport protein ExbD